MWLPRTPSQSFDRRLMSGKSIQRLSSSMPIPLQILPNIQYIIIPTACQIFPVSGPLQPAHFLRVSSNRRNDVFPLTHVVVDDLSAATTAAQDVRVPREGSNAGRVALHNTEAFHLRAVPEFYGATGRAHGQDVAFLDPGKGTNIIVALEFEELFDVSSACFE